MEQKASKILHKMLPLSYILSPCLPILWSILGWAGDAAQWALVPPATQRTEFNSQHQKNYPELYKVITKTKIASMTRV